MSDSDLRSGSRLEGLAALRGPCPDVDRLLSFASGNPDEETRSHVLLCPACATVVDRSRNPPPAVDDVNWRLVENRLERRGGPWRRRRSLRPVLALAAALMLAVGLTWWQRPTPAVDPGVRGTGFSGASAVDDAGAWTLGWTTEPLAHRYRVLITSGSSVVWQQETASLRLELPRGLLRQGETYAWRVEALAENGQLIRTTAPGVLQPSLDTRPPRP